jgi:hypothetical protein
MVDGEIDVVYFGKRRVGVPSTVACKIFFSCLVFWKPKSAGSLKMLVLWFND